MAEIIHLSVEVPGIASKGDWIVHDPTHPNPRLRLSRVVPLDEALLPLIKDGGLTRPLPESGAPPLSSRSR